jgi:hypothetical protein
MGTVILPSGAADNWRNEPRAIEDPGGSWPFHGDGWVDEPFLHGVGTAVIKDRWSRNDGKRGPRSMLYEETLKDDSSGRDYSNSELQQRHKGSRPDAGATSRKQEDTVWCPLTNLWVGGREASNRDFRRVTESERLDIVEGSAPSESKEETSKAQPSEKNKARTLLGNSSRRAALRTDQRE